MSSQVGAGDSCNSIAVGSGLEGAAQLQALNPGSVLLPWPLPSTIIFLVAPANAAGKQCQQVFCAVEACTRHERHWHVADSL